MSHRNTLLKLSVASLLLIGFLISCTKTSYAQGLSGDANGDGKVDGVDYGIWLTHYNTNTSGGPINGDFSRDGTVDGVDYVVWLNHYGMVITPTPTQVQTPVSPTTTPSPAPPGSTVDWPQLQKDAQHTGRTSVSLGPNYQVAWAWADKTHIVKNFVSSPGNNIFDKATGMTFNIMFAGQMQPIVAAGKAYFGAMNGTLYAVNALTGDNAWDFSTGGPILNSAAYVNGIVIVGSMDGKVYGLDANTGALKWSQPPTAAGGFSSAPSTRGNTVFIGSRDGKFYAIDAPTGNINWSVNINAPIVVPASISEDGTTVFFGAENMNFYALNASNGTNKWGPKKLIGQSFLYGWPVVKGDKLIVRTMSSLDGAEWLMEAVLDGLPANPNWQTQEKPAILNWLTQNPHQKSMYVFDVTTGNEPYQVAMGRVTGNNYTAFPPIVDNLDRVLTYWRSTTPTFVANMTHGECFGTNHCPDISAMDINTGDRIPLNNPSNNKIAPELDNGFQLSVGGNYLYLANHFRGTHAINLTTGNLTRMTTHSAKWDGGDFRAWGFQIIYYGNDSEPSATYTNAKPPSTYNNTSGYAGVVTASTNNIPMLYINEGDAGFIAAIKQKP